MKNKLMLLLGFSSMAFAAGATANYLKDGKYYLYINNDNNTVECSVNVMCDLKLMPGDTPDHWIISDATAWKDSTADTAKYPDNDGVMHVVLQSTQLQPATKAILVGAKYSYIFMLKSVSKAVTNNYVFVEDSQAKFNKEAIIEESINFAAIPRKDTQYYIKGDTDSAFNPVEVFNDGKKTYIKLPANIDTGEMPSIKSFSPQGRLEEATGCRFKYPFYVCDSLYPRLALILGSAENPDDNVQRVNIFRGKKPSGWSWLMQQYNY